MKQGRHRSTTGWRGRTVGQMLETIMNVALSGPPRFQPKSRLDEKNAATPAPATIISPARLGVGLLTG